MDISSHKRNNRKPQEDWDLIKTTHVKSDSSLGLSQKKQEVCFLCYQQQVLKRRFKPLCLNAWP